MAELDRSVVLAFLNFKCEGDGYIAAIHGGGELHHIVAGDAYSCFWLSVSDQPLSDDMEATPLLLDRVGVVRGVLSATKRAVPTIDVSFDPENGLCFFTAYLTAPVCIADARRRHEPGCGPSDSDTRVRHDGQRDRPACYNRDVAGPWLCR